MSDAATQYETLLIEKKGAVDWVTMNRPEALNSLNTILVDELLDYFGKLYFDRSVRIVVLRRCGQPIIALVQGPACGGGFALALASDIRIAGQSARMNAAFIRIGLSACDIGVSYFLPRLVGVSVASELMLTGRFINAERALRAGLVSEVVPDEYLARAAEPYIEEMITTSPLGLRLTKECLNMSVDAPSLEAAINMEDRNQILCSQTSDVREGMTAFLEKRKPNYTNS